MARRNSPQGTLPSGKRVLYPIHEGQQRAFMETDAEEVLYGGAAGGGKSYALRAMLVDYCLRYPGAIAVLFRRTFRELEDTHIIRLSLEVPSYVATYKSSSHDFLFPNGSMLMLRFCEKETDVYSYDTFECDIMAFDELTAFSEFQFVYLLTRCRSTKEWWPGRRIRAATNPGNVGHLWVKKRWVSFAKPMEKKRAPNNEGGMVRQFIPAKIQDNPTLMKIDPNYVNILMGLPDEERRAKLYGDWDVFSGQYFKRWRDEVHVVEDFQPPADWERIITMDWGLAAPYSVHWLARVPGTNFVWAYREHYGDMKLGSPPTREQARKARQATEASGEKIKIIVVDPATFAKEKDAEGNLMASVADVWKEEFSGIADVIKGNNERLQGASLFRECLDWQGVEDENGVTVLVPPRLRFMRNACPNAIRTIPALIHAKNNVEDVDTDGEDHAYDELRYGLRYFFGAPARPKHQRFISDAMGNIISLPG